MIMNLKGLNEFLNSSNSFDGGEGPLTHRWLIQNWSKNSGNLMFFALNSWIKMQNKKTAFVLPIVVYWLKLTKLAIFTQ